MKFTHDTQDKIWKLTIEDDLIGQDDGTKMLESATEAANAGINLCCADIGKVRFMNSSGLGLLITLLTKFRNKGGEMYLVNPSSSVQKLLIITKLTSIFNIAPTVEEAVSKLKNTSKS